YLSRFLFLNRYNAVGHFSFPVQGLRVCSASHGRLYRRLSTSLFYFLKPYAPSILLIDFTLNYLLFSDKKNSVHALAGTEFYLILCLLLLNSAHLQRPAECAWHYSGPAVRFL